MKHYTKEHEWVEVADGQATIGISTYAAKELGDITFVELPEIGTELDAGDVLCVIESVKAAADIYAPLGGTVAKVNAELEDKPEIVNDSPEENGWVCKLDKIDEGDLTELMSEEDYVQFVRSQ